MNTPSHSCDTKIATAQSLFQQNAAPRLAGWIWLAVVTAGLLVSAPA